VIKKNNWDEIARVFMQVKILPKGSLGQSGGRLGRGHVQVEEQTLEGNGSKWSPAVRQGYKGETAWCQSKEEETWDGSDLTVLFQEVVSVL
jgi:hypothetical protein